MPQRLKPTSVNFTTVTTQGEVTVNINLTLTIEMDQTGNLKVSAATKDTPDYITQLPDWEPVKPEELIDFGEDN